MPEPEGTRGSWAKLANLDKLLEHRTRLAVCLLLSCNDSLSFSRFRAILGETDGNLGAHLRKLEENGYLRASKRFQDRRPVTWYALTPQGRKVLRHHLQALKELIEEAG